MIQFVRSTMNQFVMLRLRVWMVERVLWMPFNHWTIIVRVRRHILGRIVIVHVSCFCFCCIIQMKCNLILVTRKSETYNVSIGVASLNEVANGIKMLVLFKFMLNYTHFQRWKLLNIGMCESMCRSKYFLHKVFGWFYDKWMRFGCESIDNIYYFGYCIGLEYFGMKEILGIILSDKVFNKKHSKLV
jgi:hypothetical protein